MRSWEPGCEFDWNWTCFWTWGTAGGFKSGAIAPEQKGLQVRAHRSGLVVVEADIKLELGGFKCEAFTASACPQMRSRVRRCGIGLPDWGSQKQKVQ